MNLEYKNYGVLVKKQCLNTEDLRYITDFAKNSVFHKSKISSDQASGILNARVRRCWTTKPSESIGLDYITRPLHYSYLEECNIRISTSQLESSTIENTIIRYKSDDVGFFDWHSDNNGNKNPYRLVSMSLILNSNYAGGDFLIKKNDYEIHIPLEKNSCVLFRSNLMHTVTPVTHGDRIVLVSWLHCLNSSQILEELDSSNTN